MIRAVSLSLLTVGMLAGTAHAQDKPEQHGRKWKPLPELSHIVITVEKGYNGKPLQNAAVVFHAVRDGANDGNLELKTDPDGRATMDLIEVGSHVTIQVIAPGFATYATDFDVTGANQEMLVKLQRPRAQVSTYEDNDGKASQRQNGVQEHKTPKKVTPSSGTIVAPGGASTTPVVTPDGTGK